MPEKATLKRAHQDVRAIRIQRWQREPVVAIVGGIGLFRRCKEYLLAGAAAAILARAIECGGVIRDRAYQHTIRDSHKPYLILAGQLFGDRIA